MVPMGTFFAALEVLREAQVLRRRLLSLQLGCETPESSWQLSVFLFVHPPRVREFVV